MSDYDMLTEDQRAEYEREYGEWLDLVDQNSIDEDPLPEDLNILDEDQDLDSYDDEEGLIEHYDETYIDEDEWVDGYDDLIDRDEDYRELDFND
jgi:hypothetical protein